MSVRMAFRKDCEECGHSFLTPDRVAKICPRCAGKGRKMEHPSKTAVTAKAPDEKRPPRAPAPKSAPQHSKKPETSEIQAMTPDSKAPKEDTGKPESGQTPEALGRTTEKPEIVLTEEQTKEIINRYQAYVEVMERPPKGRRKTIAAEMGLPNRTVVVALRTWNQAQQKDLNREDRFSVEKAYFSFLEKEKSFAQLKEQICREIGLDSWSVSRYLDVLHDGEDKLKKVPDVSPEQKSAILAEYKNYLAGSAPPDLFLHPLIAEKTGGSPKQVHKVLLAYRLDRFRERWG